MKIRFLFKKKARTATDGLIYIALYLRDQTELISTGQRIPERDWNPEDQFPRQHLGEVAKRINAVHSQVNKAITRLQAREEIVTPFSIKQEFNAFENDRLSAQIEGDIKAKADQKSIKHLVNQWLNNNLFHYAPSTQKSVRESLDQFLSFLTKSGLANIEKKELKPSIITLYEKFLQEKKKLSNSTHGKRMKHLRWFLKHISYDVNAIKIRRHTKGIISLTQQELEALEAFDVSKNSEQQKVKDLFLLGCYTGQRISDLKRINHTHIVNGRLSLVQKKSKQGISIPVLPKTHSILSRYGMKAPKINEQAVNREIKLICKAVGMTQLITVHKNVAGMDLEEQVAKYSQITTHVASKTFISLAPEWYGLTPAEVAAIVGKNLKTLLSSYYNLPRESAIKKMENSNINQDAI